MKLTPVERHSLLRLARESLERHYSAEPPPLPPHGGNLGRRRGAFVTLRDPRGGLRGCIGILNARAPLADTIVEMALASALRDPRFPPLRAAELPAVRIEISVISPLRPCPRIDDITVGVHGLYLAQGERSGLLLPQVAVEQGWDRETFLEHTCLKAGLDRRSWREASVFVFTAEVFSEHI